MQRSTFSIEEDLMQKIRQRASKERKTIGMIVNTLLRSALKDSAKNAEAKKLKWKTFSAGGVLADVNDRDALDAAMSEQ